MNEQSDAELLRAYAENRSETAFAELVDRYVDFTYSAALRLVRDPHLAEDVTQGAFLALARNAAPLAQHPLLSGWLHRTARNIAAQTVRTIERRRAREQEAATMNELLANERQNSWQTVAPHLDAALAELDEDDRDALLLRYFHRKSAGEMAAVLGISAEAAQKRVGRAVERLRVLLSKKQVTIGASGLAGLISVNAVQSAPAALAGSISAAVFAGTAVSTASLFAITKSIAMTTLQKTLVTITITALAGAGVYEACQAAHWRTQSESLSGRARLLQSERDQATNQVADLAAENARLKSQSNPAELMKLRGQAGQAQTALRELAKARAVQSSRAMLPAVFSNAMAHTMSFGRRYLEAKAQERVARMREELHLTDDQAQGIENIMLNNIQNQMQQTLQAMQNGGGATATPVVVSEETQIKALLTPDQLALYPDFLHSEADLATRNRVNSELTSMSSEMELTADQQTKIRAALYQYDRYDRTQTVPNAVAEAATGGDLAATMSRSVDAQKQVLADKIQLLQDILTPDQMQIYQQKQTEMIDMAMAAADLFQSPTNHSGAGQ